MRISLDLLLCMEDDESEGKIIKFPLFNDDWTALNDQKNSDENTAEGSFSQSTGFNFKLPALYDQWMSMKNFENGLQIVLKDDQNAKENALNCLESDWLAVLERYLFTSEDSFLPDITLEVGPEKTLFKVHKFILALGCDVFKAMFFGPLAEKGEKVIIPDVPSDGFKILLRYFYGAHIVLTDEDEAFDAWIAADKYCVQQLKEECENFFSRCIICVRNVWKLYKIALFVNLVRLISKCKKFILKYTEISLCSESFLEAELEIIQEIFNLPILRVSELYLIKSVILWGKNQVKIGNARSLRAALTPVLPNFPFCALTPMEFCKFLDYNYDLLNKLDSLIILKHLTKPFIYPLPQWCSRIYCPFAHPSGRCNHKFMQLYKCMRRKKGTSKNFQTT